jgi:dTDP-4-dehydrorhamnose 3,5-epimerase
MEIIPASIEDVLIIKPRVFRDQRGFFMETYRQDRYSDIGIHKTFVQDNLSFSVKGTLRGLHFQRKNPQAKLVQVISGEIFDVAVDIRHGSPTFGKWTGVYLSEQTLTQVFVPEGFAHGFCVLSETALFLYKCSDFYAPDDEGGILWSDPDIAIDWPIKDPVVSDKDRKHPCLRNMLPGQLFS